MNASVQIRNLKPNDARQFWELRLEALQKVPLAFGESVREHKRTPIQETTQRLRQGVKTGFILGAFIDGELVGVAGLLRSRVEKIRHKGLLWGVYVKDSVRSRGIGGALLKSLISRATLLPGLEQIRLAVGTDQATAKKLYLSLGFKTYGVERRCMKVGDKYVDIEHMDLTLQPRRRKPSK